MHIRKKLEIWNRAQSVAAGINGSFAGLWTAEAFFPDSSFDTILPPPAEFTADDALPSFLKDKEEDY